MSKKNFGYANAIQDEIGIYVVCNDGALLSVLNQLMRRKGFVSVSDTAGRQHYIIDARMNPMLAAKRFEELMFTDGGRAYESISDRNFYMDELDSAIAIVLSERQFDRTLAGTKLLARLLKTLLKTGEPASFKKLYVETGKKYDMSAQQVERNIRYSIQKRKIWQNGMKNSKAFMLLVDEISNILE